MATRVLFVGDSWLGSCARSFREALARRTDLLVEEVSLDHFFPRWGDVRLRALRQAIRPWLMNEVGQRVQRAAQQFQPDLVIVYKGTQVTPNVVRTVRALGARTVNIYPDASPLTQTDNVRRTLDAYDLVVSTKPWHPAAWRGFGFSNACRFVAQGYDPLLHLCATAPNEPTYDVAMVATFRPEYGRLIQALAGGALRGRRVALYGYGWAPLRASLPSSWVIPGEATGRSYVEALRSASVLLAPVTREVVFRGRSYPGDEDSTRTYELPAAFACFVHKRTPYVETLFNEGAEALFYDNARDLGEHVERLLTDAPLRQRLACAAHARAVPAYSLDVRAAEFIGLVRGEFGL